MKFTITEFNPLEVQIIATAFVLLWFEFIHGQIIIKKIICPKYEKIYRKPYDCRQCNHFWLGSLFGIFFIFTEQLENGLIYLALNFLTSYFYDKLQNGAYGRRPSENKGQD
jgi:hypothetical protein